VKYFIAAAIAVALTSTAVAASKTTLSAQESSPKSLAWMQGFPPSASKTIRFTDADYFTFPKLRWTACHFRELMPTVAVNNGSDGAHKLPVALDASLDKVSFKPLGSKKKMTWAEAFDANYSDGVLVLHHGQVVYERYAGCLSPNTLHGAMSVTKSLTGLLGEILVAEGKLSETALVGSLIPELKDSAFGDATVRQVMDMTTALDYSEDYADPNAEVWTYAQAGSPLPKPDAYKGPRSYFEFLQTVKKKGEHGAAFGYKTVNADVLGWLIARSTGQSVAQQLSERIWSRIGAEREAFYTVDSIGTPFAGGGFNATLRDLGRLGLLMLNNGQLSGQQILPVAAVASIQRGGNKTVFAKSGYTLLPGWSYASMWWNSHNAHGAYAARGVHGQMIWVDPKADMVIVRFASNPVAANAASDPTSLPAYQAIAEHLMATDKTPLQGQEWLIEDIASAGIIDRSHASLHFLPDGKIAGSASCNRFFGRYSSSGKKLSIEQVGTTMMACPEALMNQESKLLKLLPMVERYRIDKTGALILTTTTGKTILARR